MKLPGAILGVIALAACSGLGPTPAELAATLPPRVELSEEQRAQVEAATAQALSQLRKEHYDEARRAAQAALDLDPRAATARAVRARCTMQEAMVETPPLLGPWRRAEGNLRIAERLLPADPEIALLHAAFLEADGHLSLAAETVERALGTHPHHPRCLRMASRLRYELGEERTALPLLESLLKIDPSDDTARYRLARAQLRVARTRASQLDDDAEKIALYENTATSFAIYRSRVPADAEGLTGEAVARFEIQRLSKPPDPAELHSIVELLTTASRMDTQSPESEFNRGVVLEFAGAPEAARAAYRVALERDPEHLPSLLNLAANLVAAGRRAEAVEFCRRALALSPTSAERASLQRFLASSPG